MTDKQIQRTYAEEFRLTYGYDWPYEHRICTGALPEIEVDDMSELYYKVMRYRELAGYPDDAFLRCLREAEEIIDEAQDIVDAFEPPQSYLDAVAEYEARHDWEE